MSKKKVSVWKENIYMYVQFKRDWLLIATMVLTTIANGLVPAVTSILTGKVFDLLKDFADPNIPKDHNLYHQLVLRSMSLMALAACAFPLIWTSISTWMSFGEGQGFTVRYRMLNSYLDKSMEWYDKKENLSGDFTQLNRCVEELRASSAEASAITLQNISSMLSLIGVSFYYSWSLTLIILCGTPLLIILAFIFSRSIQKYAALENTESGLAADLLAWSMNSAQMIKLSCTQLKEIESFEELTLKCNDYFIKLSLYVAANISTLRFLSLAMFVQGFWFGNTEIRKGNLNISDVITCFSSCLMLGSTLNTTLGYLIFLQKGQVALRKIQSFLNDNKVEIDESALKQIDISKADISFRHVSFSYPSRPADDVLNDISIDFLSGKTTFIVGRSGSGKSTLSNLLLKLYDEYDGYISIGSTHIREIDQQVLIKNITVVEQRCTLFNDTLVNNILLGSQDEDKSSPVVQKKLKEAIKMACLESVIDSLSNGLDTILGTGGISLSGGQQQRVALARAYMRDTEVLILDEAVSALDIVHREQLMSNITKWRQGRTTIILTHELSQISIQDYLYVVEEGRIIESGFQGQLMYDPDSAFCRMNILQNVHDKYENNDRFSSVTLEDEMHSALDWVYKDDLITPITGENQILKNIDKYIIKDNFSIKEVDKVSVRSTDNSFTSDDSLPKDIEGKPKVMTLREVIKRMIRDARSKSILVFGLVCSIAAGVANPIFSWAFSYLLNGIVPTVDGPGSPSYLVKWSIIVLCVSGADAVSNFLKTFILGYCSEYWIMDLRNRAMEEIAQKKLEWFSREENKSPEIAALLMNDLRDLRSLVSQFLSVISTFLTVSLVGLIWAIATGWKLSLVCISMFPLIVIFSIIYGTVLKNYETTYKTKVANLENLEYEIITGVKTIKCLQLQNHFKKCYHKLKDEMGQIARKRAIVTGLGIAITTAIATTIQSILYYYGLKLVMDGEYSTRTMFQTFTLLLFTVMTCNSLISQIPDISRGQRAASWIYRIIEESEDTKEQTITDGRFDEIHCGEKVDKTQPLVSIHNLEFAYPTALDVNIYDNLSLDLNVGQTVAIVGESGSGKSTLVYLLTKLYQVADNCIDIDGTDVNEWDNETLRRQISVVEQKPVLFPGTVRENLIYGLYFSPLEIDIIDILKYVGVYDFIESLPEGLETSVDTSLISGGQAQRLCIARALLRKPKILILDECTSALDANSSKIINDIVAKGPPSLLTISITHNEQMMRSCNTVAVLKDGKICETGPFNKLFKPGNELYKVVANLE
ncbi:hypothetical protein Kpol_1018p185 [Vanderwaltozyma polyspora DSM 70294]|uniref:Alpha-factor-transporting ATPase n=1 Tax=Vanderwaltozyma polyspora (strain ATCC 22028 / DSM 70294 / BCRC 21397 / CBS 2163 / NBRC 10782 / NRRL Y-8283 / UCD 57-17) TaxID=436907 RepID=A7TE25_VANPO|nr:uncharacterized protein Kpol_1018p185 [Vanderwaltozyma polyspora DSM 70294]EDO19645.1 hypothetical protein Kpol_1018p185 [Vanderwaltozyma polyspora DSM 70294]